MSFQKQPKILHGIEANGALSFDNSGHILTMASGTNTYWYKGTRYTTASAITCDLDSFETLTTNTLYYFYFDDASGTLKCNDSSWSFKDNVFVATVFWNGSAGSLQKENHNHTRDLDWHEWAHDTIGTRYESGSTLTLPTTGTPGSLQIETGSYHDEDLDFATGQCTTMRGWYKASASVYTYADYSLPYLGTAGQPQYLDTDTYTLTNVGASDFVCMWVYVANSDRFIQMIPTQDATAHNTVALARAETVPQILNMNLNPEMKLIYKFIYKGDGSFVESVDYRSSSPLPGGGVETVAAGSVSFSPTGGISSTNVQSALAELDTEKISTVEGTAVLSTGEAGGTKFLREDGDGTCSWQTVISGSSFWTAVSGTRASNTTFTIAGDVTAIFAKGLVVKWTDTTTHVGMVSIPSTYSNPNTTITIVGDVCSASASDFKYAMIGAEPFIAKFAVAGTIGATGTDVANAYYALEPMRVLGADLQVGTAGTTNSTTIDINIGGTTAFTTKPTLATTVATSPTPFTADDNKSLALADRVSIDVDAIQTTSAVDLYVQLYVYPTRYLSLT